MGGTERGPVTLGDVPRLTAPRLHAPSALLTDVEARDTTSTAPRGHQHTQGGRASFVSLSSHPQTFPEELGGQGAGSAWDRKEKAQIVPQEASSAVTLQPPQP